MRRLCPRCTVLAGELLDFPNMTSWVKSFQRILGAQPKYWGLHNYRDANRLQTSNTRRLLKATGNALIWFTETGGIVSRTNRNKVTFPESADHAAKADDIPVADGPAFNQDIALARIQKTIDQLERSGFAGTTAAQEHQRLAAADLQINVVE